jgi:hypothetical protein
VLAPPKHVLGGSANGEIIRTDKIPMAVSNGENGKFQEMIVGMSLLVPASPIGDLHGRGEV